MPQAKHACTSSHRRWNDRVVASDAGRPVPGRASAAAVQRQNGKGGNPEGRRCCPLPRPPAPALRDSRPRADGDAARTRRGRAEGGAQGAAGAGAQGPRSGDTLCGVRARHLRPGPDKAELRSRCWAKFTAIPGNEAVARTKERLRSAVDQFHQAVRDEVLVAYYRQPDNLAGLLELARPELVRAEATGSRREVMALKLPLQFLLNANPAQLPLRLQLLSQRFMAVRSGTRQVAAN